MRSPCTPWQGAVTRDGYPCRKYRGRFVYVHREALAGALGRPLRRGMEAAHRCGNRACINPAHLVECSHAENCRMPNPRRAA